MSKIRLDLTQSMPDPRIPQAVYVDERVFSFNESREPPFSVLGYGVLQQPGHRRCRQNIILQVGGGTAAGNG